MSVASIPVAATFTAPLLRITESPPEPYDLAPVYSIAEAQAQQEQEHRQWLADVFREFERSLFWFAIKETEGNWYLADDIVQECFAGLLQRPPAAPVNDAKRYIFAVCRRKIHDLLVSSNKRLAKTLLCGEFRRLRRPRPLACGRVLTPVQALQGKELFERVDAAIQTLTPTQGRRLRMRIHDGMSSRQITEAEGLNSRSVVPDGIKRSLVALRGKLGDDVQPTNKPPRNLRISSMEKRRYYDVWCISVDPPRRFSSTKEAAQFAGCRRKSVQTALAGSSTAGGHRWEWRERPEGKRERSPEQLAYYNRGRREDQAAG